MYASRRPTPASMPCVGRYRAESAVGSTPGGADDVSSVPLLLLVACVTSKLARKLQRFRNSPCTPKRRRLTKKRGGSPAPFATVGTESTPVPKNEWKSS